MAYTQDGLPNGGQVNIFSFNYEQNLGLLRGTEFTKQLMQACEADYLWLKSFFTGAPVGFGAVKVHVWIPLLNDGSSNATWSGDPHFRYEITLNIDATTFTGRAAVDLARQLMIAEVSEMLMRERQGWMHSNDWFGVGDEGSKGESLSNVFMTVFSREKLGVSVSSAASWVGLWLNGGRPDFVSTNVETRLFNVTNGCGIAFLLYLLDQRGFPLQQIIDAGSGTLAGVYENLTGDRPANAFAAMNTLVEQYYPIADGPQTPALESLYPVANLIRAVSTGRATWISNGISRPSVFVTFDKVIPATAVVHLQSSHPGIVPSSTVGVSPGVATLAVPLTIIPQTPPFGDQVVTISVSYAGAAFDCQIDVVNPDQFLPELTIGVNSSSDPCTRFFEEGTRMTLVVRNLSVFADTTGLKYDWQWQVAGAATSTSRHPHLEVTLPSAGTEINVTVTVTAPSHLQASGKLSFKVLAALSPIDELERRVRCKIASMPAFQAYLPSWIPLIDPAKTLTFEQINVISERIQPLLDEVAQVGNMVAKLKKARSG